MQLIAAKSMTYATRRLSAGDLFTAAPRDARVLVALKRARQVGASAVPAEKPAEIPENWQELEWPKLRSLASDVSETPITSKADAVAAIEAELKRRAG